MQNGFIERFNRSYRQAVLDMFVFQTLNEVREQTEMWLKEYNEERPHDALGDMTPREYLLTQKPEISTYGWSKSGILTVHINMKVSRRNTYPTDLNSCEVNIART